VRDSTSLTCCLPFLRISSRRNDLTTKGMDGLNDLGFGGVCSSSSSEVITGGCDLVVIVSTGSGSLSTIGVLTCVMDDDGFSSSSSSSESSDDSVFSESESDLLGSPLFSS